MDDANTTLQRTFTFSKEVMETYKVCEIFIVMVYQP